MLRTSGTTWDSHLSLLQISWPAGQAASSYGGALTSNSACLPGLRLFSLCNFARLWDRLSHQPGWLDRCNLLSCLVLCLCLMDAALVSTSGLLTEAVSWHLCQGS